MIQRPLSKEVCPRCVSIDVRYDEKFYCMVCKKCGLQYKNM